MNRVNPTTRARVLVTAGETCRVGSAEAAEEESPRRTGRPSRVVHLSTVLKARAFMCSNASVDRTNHEFTVMPPSGSSASNFNLLLRSRRCSQRTGLGAIATGLASTLYSRLIHLHLQQLHLLLRC